MANPIAKYLLMAAGMGLALGIMFLLDSLSPTQEEEPFRLSGSSSAAKLQEEEEEEEEEGTVAEWIAANEHRVQEEDFNLPEMLGCKICLNARRRVTQVFACGHSTCLECAVRICQSDRGCPFDRRRISRPPRPLHLS